MSEDRKSPPPINSETRSCSPVGGKDVLVRKSKERNTLILAIGFRYQREHSSDNFSLLPYVKRIVDRGQVLVDNENREEKLKVPKKAPQTFKHEVRTTPENGKKLAALLPVPAPVHT